MNISYLTTNATTAFTSTPNFIKEQNIPTSIRHTVNYGATGRPVQRTAAGKRTCPILSCPACLISPQPSTPRSIRSPPSLGRLLSSPLVFSLTPLRTPSLRHPHFQTFCPSLFDAHRIPDRGRIRLQSSLIIICSILSTRSHSIRS
jgi:hypothetical protein